MVALIAAAAALAPTTRLLHSASTRRSVLQHIVPVAGVLAASPMRVLADEGILTTVLDAGDATSPLAQRAQTAVVDYTLWIDSFGGKQIDSKRGFEFRVGVGQVIRGWDMTVGEMHLGEKRRVVIPSSLGYGAAGVGPIPGGADLFFEIALRELKPTKEQQVALDEARAQAEAAARTPAQQGKVDKAALMKQVREQRMEEESRLQSLEYQRIQSSVGTRSFGSTVSVQARPTTPAAE